MQDEKDQHARGLSKSPTERYWEWLTHEDNLFSNRVTVFLIAQSMLFIPFAINAYSISSLTWIIGTTGIVVLVIWIYVSVVQVFFLINPIKARLREQLPEYRDVKDIWAPGDPNIWLGIIFPLILMVVWILLIIQQ